MLPNSTYVLRPATAGDDDALAWLASRDEQAPLRHPILLAEIDGAPAAALSLSDGRAIGDPFRPTADLIAFLRLGARPVRTTRARRLGARMRRPALALQPA